MRVFIHPTRGQFEVGYRSADRFMQLSHKLQKRMAVEPFTPVFEYHAVVVLAGVHDMDKCMRTALKLLVQSPIGFKQALSWTWWVSEHPRPFIGLIAAERPLDKNEALRQFADCGVVPGASG